MMTSPTTAERTVVLSEFDSALLQLTAEQARELRRAADGAVTVQPDDTAGTWRITTSHYVGTIVTSATRILIRPKVSTGSLFYLLEAGGKPVETDLPDFAYDSTADLLPSFATFYARHLEQALARGIPRTYQERQERLPQIRGRPDLPAQLRLAGLPLTADTHLARLLHGAARRLLLLPGITSPTRKALQRLAATLNEAAPCTPQDIRTPVTFTRLNEHCRPAERLARLILGNQTLHCSAGATGAATFLIDMNSVFETFIASRLRRYLAGQLTVRTQQTQPLGHGGTAKIRPDLIFERTGGATVYVADTKYKITADGYARDTDYYQILAYATALDVPAGMLIYCQNDGHAPPRSISVGAHRTRLDTCAVQLTGSPQDIEHRIKHLASQITDRTQS
jgi:5-methylcytosine-specific restriction enzyme subunit McrC